MDNDKELIYTVKNKDKYPSKYIECDSKIEVDFANDADISENCKKFIKLPNSYKIHTPCGSYNPDWGIYHTEQEVIIIENKGSENKEQLRSSEELKINCAKKHFGSIGVKYRVKNKYDL